ncbi:MAG: tyrosine-protein phosphatase [Acidimicrobiales bacterium]|nr:tyrosine-protein phosphatase [Acidimicrobiales bacterium]
MDIGGPQYAAVGGVHAVPVANVAGTLILCGLDAIGPDPAALVAVVEATAVVCLQTETEMARRYPTYLDWLATPGSTSVVHLPTEDHLVTDDDAVADLVLDIHRRMSAGGRVLVHCGAGWGRAGVIAVLVMCAAGADIDTALRDLRLARPAAGPQSAAQDLQVARIAPRVRESVTPRRNA